MGSICCLTYSSLRIKFRENIVKSIEMEVFNMSFDLKIYGTNLVDFSPKII